MSSLLIPADWKVKRSTPFFTKENVPAALLSHHNTAAGVFASCASGGHGDLLRLPMNKRRSRRKKS